MKLQLESSAHLLPAGFRALMRPPEAACQLPLCSLTMCAQSLRRELQMVKETLQAMILQLQPAKEAGGEAAASWMTAGVREAQTWGVTGWGKEGK